MSGGVLWTWTPVAEDPQFARAYHTCTPIRGKLYLYGGVKSSDPKEPPLDSIATFDPENMAQSGTHGGLFRRSHHDAVALSDKWLYDTETEQWASWAEEQRSHPPAGLSSHTCTKISDHELCVVGREGGLRTQRRYASVYTLRVNASAKTYRYREEEWRTASRSGHSAVLLQSDIAHGTRDNCSLYVFGGRESSAVDLVGSWKAGRTQENTAPSSRLVEQLCQLVASVKAVHEAPKNLRHHSCSAIGPFLVVFGGETLSKSRDAICNELYVCDTRCTPMSWFRFPRSDPLHKRVGHRTVLLNDRLYLVGGFGVDGRTPCPEISVLDFL
ncbi:hypothetical protein GDO78_015856 [Eleutherodactylus coqui]|uniref:Attractin/MKLN-like beta-propeller domain-containing protein n=1 Tax=Eleutherodactylus coqui TaxID=57060 RepID=A0A8J6ED78_ELECQ|nr:hypothetical protein GDO78_015856 [Eleutherodactylus coqui]